MSAFHAQGLSSFSGKPMEKVINDVDIHVDKTFGNTNATFEDEDGIVHNPLTFRRSMKYSLIFQISSDLPVELKQIRTFLLQESEK